MRMFRSVAIALLAVSVIPVSAQASLAGMPPEGRALVSATLGKGSDELVATIREMTDIRKRIESELCAEHPDWAKLRAMLHRSDFLDVHGRQISAANDEALLDKLSAADRLVYLRNRYPPESGPPKITTTP